MIGRLRPLLILLVALSALVGVTSAAAAQPTLASGNFAWTATSLTHSHIVNGNFVSHLTGNINYTGTFAGTSLVEGTLIFYPDGSAKFTGTEQFTGAVTGVAGTVRLTTHAASTSLGAFTGTADVEGGTEGLAHIDGVLNEVGTASQNNPPSGTYTGTIHFGKS